MRTTDTVIIGAGQAGLAMSRCLTDRSIDHVVLERGRVAERWRSARWDSLRLLTPNWQTRLPGHRYQGADPHGFMTVSDLTRLLERYADLSGAPVEEETAVLSVTQRRGGYLVQTDQGAWQAESVVIATGYAAVPKAPAFAARLHQRAHQLVPTRYRNPSLVPEGGVLVVGASASGIQIADELHATGRDVVLSAGRHTRLPRRYRGRDIMWWLDRIGALDETTADVHSVEASRRQPSLQLMGSVDHRSIDLGTLAARGVQIVGRTAAAEGGRVFFNDNLQTTTAAADAKLTRLLRRIDRYASARGIDRFLDPAAPIPPISLAPSIDRLDLRARNIRTVLWATGFARNYSWLRLPVLDRRGELLHHGGVTSAPGLYALGLNFMRRRKSVYIDGVGADAEEIATHLHGYLAGPASRAPQRRAA